MKEVIVSEDEKKLVFKDDLMLIIPDKLLGSYQNVEEVYMKITNCTILPIGYLNQFRNLRKLHIVANNLCHFGTDKPFINLYYLVDIHLELARLNCFDDNTFHNLTELKKIVLIVPSVHTRIGSSPFLYTSKVTELQLTVSVAFLDSRITFDGLDNLETLVIKNVRPAHDGQRLRLITSFYVNNVVSLSLYRVSCPELYLTSKARKLILRNSVLNNLNDNDHGNLTYFESDGFATYTIPLHVRTLIYHDAAIFELGSEGLNHLVYLDISSCDIKRFHSNFLRNCRHIIKIFKFRRHSLTSVLSTMFDKCHHLVAVNLSENSINSLEESSFDSLYNLKSLHLEFNQLTCLPDKIFHNQSVLTDLNLSNNRMTCVKTKWFKGDESNQSKKHYLDSNPMKDESYQLIRLDLSSNQIECIEKDSLKMLSKLQFLDISENILNRLEEHYFENLENLFELNLSYNKLGELKRCFFKDLKVLNVLKLEHNCISIIEPDTFEDLEVLKFLDLGTNSLQVLNEKVFVRNRKLRKLLLDCNQLESIPLKLFENLERLQTLNLGETKFKFFKWECFKFNKMLIKLHINKVFIPSSA